MDEESTVARIPERLTFIIRNKREKAAMARPLKQSVQVIKDKSVIVRIVELCKQSMTLTVTGSLIDELQRGEREGDHY